MFEKEDKILELYKTIKDLKEKYDEKVKEYKELERKYLNLRCRYTNQNEELIRLKIELKGGTNAN